MNWIRLCALLALSLNLIDCSKKELPQNRLRVAFEAEVRSIDPRYSTDANSQYLGNLMHCSLVDFDENGKTIQKLAKSIEWQSPTELLVEIHEGARYWDGSPTRIDDVLQTYQFFLNDSVEEASPLKGFMNNVSSVEKVDKNKIVFTLKDPEVSFVSNLVIGILPVKLATGPRILDAKKLQGCGPYALKKVDLNSLLLTRNLHYFGEKPKSDEIEIKIVKDESTRFAKLLKGELDLVQNSLNREKVKQLNASENDKNLRVTKRAGLNATYLGFNMRDPLISRKEVRQAIAFAIDRQAIIDHVLMGLATPAQGLLLQSDPFFESSKARYDHNPKKAAELLDTAGLTAKKDSGIRFQLQYKTTTDPTRVTIAKAIASDLRSIGIDVQLQSLDWGKFKEDVEKGRAQMWSLSWIGFKDPDILRYVFAKESFPPDGGNRGFYNNSKLNELLTKAKSETNLGDRKALYSQAQKIIAEDLPYVFLWHEDLVAVLRDDIEGFELYADGRLESLTRSFRK